MSSSIQCICPHSSSSISGFVDSGPCRLNAASSRTERTVHRRPCPGPCPVADLAHPSLGFCSHVVHRRPRHHPPLAGRVIPARSWRQRIRAGRAAGPAATLTPHRRMQPTPVGISSTGTHAHDPLPWPCSELLPLLNPTAIPDHARVDTAVALTPPQSVLSAPPTPSGLADRALPA